MKISQSSFAKQLIFSNIVYDTSNFIAMEKFTFILFLLLFGATTSVNSQIQIGQDINGNSPGGNGDALGFSVNMPDSLTLAIGAHYSSINGSNSGTVRIYEWNGTDWIQKGIDIMGEAENDMLGFSVSMPNANTLAVGAPYDFNNFSGIKPGYVKIYEWNGTDWVQKGTKIEGEAADDKSGHQISMPDANTLAIASAHSETTSGYVKVYEWGGSDWLQKGAKFFGEESDDFFGRCVSMPNANTVAIGAPGYDGTASIDIGHARIYEWNGTDWVQKGSSIEGEVMFDGLGTSLSMPDDNTIGIGAEASSQVSIYEWSGTTWSKKGVDIDGDIEGDYSGWFVSMPDANTIAIGSPRGDGNDNKSGLSRVFKWDGGSWVQKGVNINGEATDDWSGISVSMPNANTVAVGAPFNADNGPYAGLTRVYGLCQITGGTDVQVACDSYTWIDGNTYDTSNNTATHTLTNESGCDSIVTLNLTINYTDFIDLSVTQADNVLTANAEDASYQWVDCNNSNLPISGETNQLFTATANGDYAVILTDGGCSDTSACINVNMLNTKDFNKTTSMNIYPNPSTGSFTVDLGKEYSNTNIAVKDVLGKTVYTKTINSDKHNIQLNEVKGIYFVNIQTEKGEQATLKLVLD